jgi:hypothetical protein
MSWEAEGCIGTPIPCGLLEDDILCHSLEVWSCDTLAEPLALHLQEMSDTGDEPCGTNGTDLRGRNRPDFEVVWSHEEICNSSSHHPDNPLIEILWLGIRNSKFQCRINHSVHTLDLVFFRQHRNVVLERIWNPEILASYVGYPLMCVPVFVFRKGFIDAVVEVFVVREDNVAADIV